MSQRLVRLEMPVFPDRRMFRLHDSKVDPDAPGGPLAPVGTLVSVNREQVWVGSLQEHISVRLTIEEWDTAPPAFGDEWEDEAKGTIYLRGQLSVEFQQARKNLEGLEQYLLQLWREY